MQFKEDIMSTPVPRSAPAADLDRSESRREQARADSWSAPVPKSPPPGPTRILRIPPPPSRQARPPARMPAAPPTDGSRLAEQAPQRRITSRSAPAARPSGPADSSAQVADSLRISAWADPLVDRLGHDPRSRYAELFWLPIIGPSTILFLRHCVTLLDELCGESDPEVEIDLATTATRLGLGHKGGRNSALVRTIQRASRFGAARPAGVRALQVRRFMAPLNRSQLERLPPGLQSRHQAAMAGSAPGHDLVSARARRLALGLMQCGDEHAAAETQLGQWQVPPAIAADAVRWAWSVCGPQGAAGNDAA